MPTGYVTYPGILNPLHMMATRTNGVRPGNALLWATPGGNAADTTGTATLSFGFNGTNVLWGNALCDRGTTVVTSRGQFQVFEILDSRWRWNRFYITKAYNVRGEDVVVDSATQATLAQIITDIFTIIGVSVDVSLVSTTEYPEVTFDYDNCAHALEELIEPRGYVVSLQMDDTAKIFPVGSGTTLPGTTIAQSEICNITFSINPAEIPAVLSVVGAQTRVQSMLKCQPVGLDTNGKIVPVASLSYAPAGGWAGVDLATMDCITNETAKELAKATVGKWYQIQYQADGTYNLNYGGVNYCPGQITVTSAKQYLPLKNTLVDTQNDPFGQPRSLPAFVSGVFYDSDESAVPPRGQNTSPFQRVEQSSRKYKIDEALGVVAFEQLARKATIGGGVITGMDFADVYLTCSYSIHDNTTHIKDRYVGTLAAGGYGEQSGKDKSLQRTLVATYTSGTSTISALTDNKSSVDTAAGLYLANAQQKLQTAQGGVILARGIYPLSPDGLALQIKWDCAINGPVPWATTVTQNYEGIPLIPTSAEKSRMRRTALMDDQIEVRNLKYRTQMNRARNERS